MDIKFYKRIIKEKINKKNYFHDELMSVILQYIDKKRNNWKKSLLNKIFVYIYYLIYLFNEKK